MKLSKAIGTVLLCCLLLLGTALALVTGLLRFFVLNPHFYQAFVPSASYCSELRARIGENLDHVAILYGLEEGVLTEVVTDADIRSYTGALIDSLFDDATTDTLTLPSFPKEAFSDYLRAHTAYSEQAISDFSEDCAASVNDDLAAINLSLLVSGFSRLRSSRLALLSPVLLLASLALVGVLIAMTATVHSESPRTGAVAIFGGLFLGISTVFVPVMVFWLFDYIGRLNLAVSAFRTILVGILSTALYGCLAVLGMLLGISFILLLIACAFAAKGKKPKTKKVR